MEWGFCFQKELKLNLFFVFCFLKKRKEKKGKIVRKHKLKEWNGIEWWANKEREKLKMEMKEGVAMRIFCNLES